MLIRLYTGASPRKFLSGGGGGAGGAGGYVNVRPFNLDKIRNLVKALQKQSSWKLVA